MEPHCGDILARSLRAECAPRTAIGPTPRTRRGCMNSGPAWVVVTHADLPNGAAHRMVGALLQAGYEVGLCAVPLPGASRHRSERILPGAPLSEPLIDDFRPVSSVREVRSTLEVARFAWSVARQGSRELVFVGCDPVSFLEGIAAFHLAPVRVRASAAWFVDWSAQRLQKRSTAAAYIAATKLALRLADVAAAITPAAAAALERIGKPRHPILVLTNQPLPVGPGRPWSGRPHSVAYIGGLSDHQGAEVLLGAAGTLGHEGVEVSIAGGGPAAAWVRAATSRLPNVHFFGVVDDVGRLAQMLHEARVGWALYNPAFPMHSYNDPLKIKDYLAAGLRVVSTLPTSTEDGVIGTAGYSVSEVVKATRAALSQPPAFEPAGHPLVVGAGNGLDTFVAAVTAHL